MKQAFNLGCHQIGTEVVISHVDKICYYLPTTGPFMHDLNGLAVDYRLGGVSYKMKILIATQSSYLLSLVIDQLSSIGITMSVQDARDVNECLGLSKSKLDVVFIDQLLVGGNPIDVVQSLKRKSEKTYIIVLAKDPGPLVLNMFRDAGADQILELPGELVNIPPILKVVMAAKNKNAPDEKKAD